MIISYKHNFIFIKCRRTAGTTTQVMLRRMMSDNVGPDDVVTPIRPVEYPMYDGAKPYRPMNAGTVQNTLFEPHERSTTIIEKIGREKFDSMFKFCFERNSWEKVVSWYLWHYKVGKTTISDFGTWFRRSHALLRAYSADRYPRPLPIDWDLYTINDKIVVDYIGRYETLQEDFEKICGLIGMEFDGVWPHMKDGSWDKDYRKYYTTDLCDLVADLFSNEIREFGYEF